MQEFISEKKETFCKARDLSIGQLAIVVENCYKGVVLTRTYNDIVAVYCPNDKAFYTKWGKDCDLDVRILEKGEKVVLSND